MKKTRATIRRFNLLYKNFLRLKEMFGGKNSKDEIICELFSEAGSRLVLIKSILEDGEKNVRRRRYG